MEPKECQEEIQVGGILVEEEAEDSRTTTTMVGKIRVPRKLWNFLHFTLVAQKKANNYKNTALFVINNIKKDFYRGNDINKDLRKLEYKNTENWNPILKAITLSDDDAKERQDKQFKLQIKADYG